MKVLIHSATELELQPIRKQLGLKSDQTSFQYAGHQLDLLVSGVGMVATAFSLSKELVLNQYDLAISVGIVGSYDADCNLGEVVEVVSDGFPELGAEEETGFRSIEELGLLDTSAFPFKEGRIWNFIAGEIALPKKWKEMHALTVNTVNATAIKERRVGMQEVAELESMEGAAFFYSCMKHGLSCIQLKAISNHVEQRDKSAWRIEPALRNLAEELEHLLKEIACKH